MDTRDMARAGTAEPLADLDALAECIEACTECAQSCIACADACLSESDVKDLAKCIRLNQDCADVADTTGRFLSRAAEAPNDAARSMLQACVAISGACGGECEDHGEQHEQCRVCAESCRKCMDACRKVIGSMDATQK